MKRDLPAADLHLPVQIRPEKPQLLGRTRNDFFIEIVRPDENSRRDAASAGQKRDGILRVIQHAGGPADIETFVGSFHIADEIAEEERRRYRQRIFQDETFQEIDEVALNREHLRAELFELVGVVGFERSELQYRLALQVTQNGRSPRDARVFEMLEIRIGLKSGLLGHCRGPDAGENINRILMRGIFVAEPARIADAGDRGYSSLGIYERHV